MSVEDNAEFERLAREVNELKHLLRTNLKVIVTLEGSSLKWGGDLLSSLDEVGYEDYSTVKNVEARRLFPAFFSQLVELRRTIEMCESIVGADFRNDLNID